MLECVPSLRLLLNLLEVHKQESFASCTNFFSCSIFKKASSWMDFLLITTRWMIKSQNCTEVNIYPFHPEMMTSEKFYGISITDVNKRLTYPLWMPCFVVDCGFNSRYLLIGWSIKQYLCMILTVGDAWLQRKHTSLHIINLVEEEKNSGELNGYYLNTPI